MCCSLSFIFSNLSFLLDVLLNVLICLRYQYHLKILCCVAVSFWDDMVSFSTVKLLRGAAYTCPLCWAHVLWLLPPTPYCLLTLWPHWNYPLQGTVTFCWLNAMPLYSGHFSCSLSSDRRDNQFLLPESSPLTSMMSLLVFLLPLGLVLYATCSKDIFSGWSQAFLLFQRPFVALHLKHLDLCRDLCPEFLSRCSVL